MRIDLNSIYQQLTGVNNNITVMFATDVFSGDREESENDNDVAEWIAVVLLQQIKPINLSLKSPQRRLKKQCTVINEQLSNISHQSRDESSEFGGNLASWKMTRFFHKVWR